MIAGIANIPRLKGKDLNGNWRKSERQKDLEKAPKMYEIGMATQELGRGP